VKESELGIGLESAMDFLEPKRMPKVIIIE